MIRFAAVHLKKYIPFHASGIKTVTRITLERELFNQFNRLTPGAVLDVGARWSPYKKYIPHTRYLRLDIDSKTTPDICADIHTVTGYDGYFDTIVAIEVLEHCYDPERAIHQIYRMLKHNGICIMSTRFIYNYHPDPKDYYRFTQDSLCYLLRQFNSVEIIPHGTKIQSLWQVINHRRLCFLNILNPLIARIPSHNSERDFPCGFIVYAKK